MRNVKTLFTVFVIVFLLLTPSLLLGTPARIFGLNSPTLNLSNAVLFGTTLSGLTFPTDELDIGVSSVPDQTDIWKFPQLAAHKMWFPTNNLLLDYTGVDPFVVAQGQGGGGLILNNVNLFGMPVAAGFYLNRQNRNEWLQGIDRGRFGAPIGAEYYNNVPTWPGAVANVPGRANNLLDVFLATKLNNLYLGVSGGWAYDKAIDSSTNIDGTPDSTTDQKSKTQDIVLRGGASFDTNILNRKLYLDLGTAFHFGNYDATYKSGAAAALPNEDDSITAKNTAWDIAARLTWKFTDKLDFVFVGDYASLPQKFKATDDGTALDTSNTQIDETKFHSVGGGLGFNFYPKENALINGLFTATYGKGTWTEEPFGAGTRPEDQHRWMTMRAQAGAEAPLSDRVKLRGGVGHSKTWYTEKCDWDTGGLDEKNTVFEFSTDAAAGISINWPDPVTLDFVVNLSNFTTDSFLEALSLRTSMFVEF